MLDAHRDCYFQIFTNGQFLDRRDLRLELRKHRQRDSPLISIEGTESIVSDERRGSQVTCSIKTLAGLQTAVEHKLDRRRRFAASAQSNFDDLVNEAMGRPS